MHSRALLVTAVNRIELAEVSIPDPGPDELLVEALLTTISPGTELRCLAGRQAGVHPPFIPGYAMVGRVCARGADTTLAEGTLVLCRGTDRASHPIAWGGHAAHAVLPEAAAIPVAAAIDLRDAAMVKLASIAYRGVRVAGTRPHDQVAVVGLGPIGQLAGRLHRAAGAHVVAADLRHDRVQAARAAGIDARVVEIDLATTFERAIPGGADVVVDASGAPSLLPHSVRLARARPWNDALAEPARLVVQGSYPEHIALGYEDAFARELTVHFPRDSQPRDQQTVLRMLESRQLVLRDLLSAEYAPTAAAEAYAALRAAKPGLITAAFRWA